MASGKESVVKVTNSEEKKKALDARSPNWRRTSVRVQ